MKIIKKLKQMIKFMTKKYTTEEAKERRCQQAKKYYQKIKERDKEKIKESAKRYYQKNREIINFNKRKIRKETKQTLIKEQPIKEQSVKFIRRNNPSKQYIMDSRLRYEIILSKGKGYPTENLKMMLYEMCIEINKKFDYNNDKDIKYDIIMNSYVDVLKFYVKYDENKYDKAFMYITEIIKRSQAKFFNMERYKGIFTGCKTYNIYYVSIENTNTK